MNSQKEKETQTSLGLRAEVEALLAEIVDREWRVPLNTVDLLQRILAALPPESGRGGWRPIETAPRNKKIIAGYRNELGNWRTILAAYYVTGTLPASDDSETDDEWAPEGWYEEGEAVVYCENLQRTEQIPTHWQPLPPAPGAAPQEPTFQARIKGWTVACFGAEIAADRTERSHRFLEEALELVQACGTTAHEAHQLVDYSFGRPVGEKTQEVGGVMLTLAALCNAQGIDMDAAGEAEHARVSTPGMIEKIRAKQAAKPKHSPLPGAAPAPSARGEGETIVNPVKRAVEWLAHPAIEKLLSPYEIAMLRAAITAPMPGPKFEKTYCSHCGGEFGPGGHGYSHCESHEGMVRR